MINVILADHQRIFRIGMASALASEDDIRIVGQPHSIDQLLHGLESFRPHVLVLSSPFLVWMAAIRSLCDRYRTAILLLEDHAEADIPRFSPDVQGIMERSEDEATVVRSIRHLARGGSVLRLVRSSHVLEERQDPVGTRVRKRLAPIELRIISLVVQGFRNREIALQMSTSEQSIKNSLRKIFDKTGVSGRLELALYVVHHRALKQAAAEAEPTQDMRSLAAIQLEWLSPLRTFIN